MGRFVDVLREGTLTEGVRVLKSLARSILKVVVARLQADAASRYAG